MHILYLHRTKAEGVEGVHIRGVVHALRQLGHQVTIISPYGTSPGEQNVRDNKYSILRRIYKFISESLPQIGFEFMEILYNLPAYRKIWNAAHRTKIDFIYERYALFGISGVNLARKLGIPIILEVNIVSDLDDVRPVKMKGWAKKLENLVLKRADAIVTVSSFLKHHIALRGIEEQKIHVLHNAVNPDEFHSVSRNEIRRKYNVEDSFIIGFVGRLLPWFKLNSLIEVVREIVLSGRDKIHLLLIGDGAMKSELNDLIQKYNLASNVTMTGWIEHSKMPDYIDAMDVAILPNTNVWCSPVKIFEYMVMAKPVVAPSYQNIKEIITSWENGILFDPGNYDDLKRVVLTLMDDEKLRRKIGDIAKKTVVENHTWMKNAEKIMKIYEDLKKLCCPL